MSLIGKGKAILGSVRFWIATLVFVLSLLESFSTGTLTLDYVFNNAQIWLGAVLAIGTLDSVATKAGLAFGSKK